MRRQAIIFGIVFATFVLLIGGPVLIWQVKFVDHSHGATSEVETVGDIKVAGNVDATHLELYKNGKWQPLTIKGVNMGISKPGYFPGEIGIEKADYAQWFKEIGAMHANAIRIYTLPNPGFYQALLAYNTHHKQPLYLFQGVWVNEDNMLKMQDVYASVNMKDFHKAIEDTINVIHGQATIKKVRGHAGGTYTADVSPYVIGWILGTEWDPQVVQNTDQKHVNKTRFIGRYFKAAQDSTPFEDWLAGMMNYTANYEMAHYKWQRPMSFTNWVTTDLLKHPSEPLSTEDMVSVNPNHIQTTIDWKAGMFASYHIYPYYPDFLNDDKTYRNYMDQDGVKDSYAGYLHDLKQHHNMPVLVAEFGVPSSRGMTHTNPLGMNQGDLTETEQGQIDAKLYRTIISENYAGGLIFTWQDEWFKRTWNTMDVDDPNQRPFWDNVQTSEQHFGLMSFDPGAKQSIAVDGDSTDWQKAGIKPIYQRDGLSSNSGLKGLDQVFVTSDEAYLYLRLDFSKPINWSKRNALVFIDTIKSQGNTKVGNKLQLSEGADFAIQLSGKTTSRVLVDQHYDAFLYQYGHQLGMIPEPKSASLNDQGVFDPIRLALNKPLTIPTQNQTIPFSSYETGKLIYGNANPNDPSYNSLADFDLSQNKKTVELRIPWALLNVKDPSTHEVMGNMWKDGLTSSAKTSSLDLGFYTYQPAGMASDNLLQSVPSGGGTVSKFYSYQWPEWSTPAYHERLKQSYTIIQNLFKNY